MDLKVSGKNLDVGASLREHIKTNLDEIVEKYYEGHVSGHAVIFEEGHGYKCDITLHLSSGIDFQADAQANEVYNSVNSAIEKIDKRLRRYKRKLKDHHHGTPQKELIARSYILQGSDDIDLDTDLADDSASDKAEPIVIAEIEKPIREMTVSQAVEECINTGSQLLLFRNAGNMEINLVHRRPDGNYGWIDPSNAKT